MTMCIMILIRMIHITKHRMIETLPTRMSMLIMMMMNIVTIMIMTITTLPGFADSEDPMLALDFTIPVM